MEAPVAFGMMFMVLLGGAGLPLGIPPEKEDELLAKIAPAECLFYSSWAGMAQPDGTSKNSTERFLADPEIRQAFAEFEKSIERVFSNPRFGPNANPEEAELIRELTHWAKFAVSHPGAVFVESVTPGERAPEIQAGMVLRVGMDGIKLKAFLEKLQQMNQRLEVTEVAVGATKFYRLAEGPSPPFYWGILKDYLIVAVGEGTVEKIVERARGTAPAWHAAIGKNLPVARRSTVTYVNIAKIRDTYGPMVGPRGFMTMAALGLDNVTEMTAITGLDETGFVSRTLIGLKGPPTGLFSFLDGKPLTGAEVASIPADSTVALAIRRDPTETLKQITAIIGRIEPEAVENFEQALGEAEEEVGVAWRRDILGSLGDTWRIYSSPADGGFVFPGLTVVVDVKDAGPLRRAIGAFLARLGERGDRQVVSISKFAGQEIITLLPPDRSLFVSPSICITENKLIMAAYPQSIKSYLGRGADFRGLDSQPEVAATLTESKPTIIGYYDTKQIVRQLYPLAPMVLAMIRAESRGEVSIDPAILPSCEAVCRHLKPGIATVSVRPEGIEFAGRQTLPGGSIGSSAPVMVGLLLPAVHAARGAAQRTTGMNNLKQIGIAMHVHHDAQQRLPAAAITSKDGKPLLSWRVKILPYIEQNALYNQFHLDEPWDSEHNKKLIAQMPQIYLAPGSRNQRGDGKTNYLTIRAADSMFPGEKARGFAEIRDGLSNSVMVVEAGDPAAVIWTKPDDYVPDEQNPMKGLFGIHPGGFNVVFGDGSVRFISNAVDPKVWQLLVTCNDGQPINPNALDAPPRPRFGPPVPPPQRFDDRFEKKAAPGPDPIERKPEAEPRPAPPGAPPRPAGQATGAQRAQGANNLKQLGLAAHNYLASYNRFPAAFIASKEGKPLLSWRVAVLPYIEEQTLYSKFRLDEPWDSEHNKKLIPLMPRVLLAPSSRNRPADGKTNYLAIRSEKSIFPGGTPIRIHDVTDGTSNTVMFVEASDDAAIEWTRPDDYVPAEKAPHAGIAGLHRDGFQACFADGAIHMIRKDVTPEVWKLLYERNDGEVLENSSYEVPPPKPLFPGFGFGGEAPAPKKAAYPRADQIRDAERQLQLEQERLREELRRAEDLRRNLDPPEVEKKATPDRGLIRDAEERRLVEAERERERALNQRQQQLQELEAAQRRLEELRRQDIPQPTDKDKPEAAPPGPKPGVAVPAPRTVPVSGKIFYAGQPLAGAQVMLLPDKPNGRSPNGTTQADGSFRLSTNRPNDGAEPGQYRVIVRGGKNLDLGKYSDPRATPLTVEVQAGQANQIDLQLAP